MRGTKRRSRPTAALSSSSEGESGGKGTSIITIYGRITLESTPLAWRAWSSGGGATVQCCCHHQILHSLPPGTRSMALSVCSLPDITIYGHITLESTPIIPIAALSPPRAVQEGTRHGEELVLSPGTLLMRV